MGGGKRRRTVVGDARGDGIADEGGRRGKIRRQPERTIGRSTEEGFALQRELQFGAGLAAEPPSARAGGRERGAPTRRKDSGTRQGPERTAEGGYGIAHDAEGDDARDEKVGVGFGQAVQQRRLERAGAGGAARGEARAEREEEEREESEEPAFGAGRMGQDDPAGQPQRHEVEGEPEGEAEGGPKRGEVGAEGVGQEAKRGEGEDRHGGR